MTPRFQRPQLPALLPPEAGAWPSAAHLPVGPLPDSLGGPGRANGRRLVPAVLFVLAVAASVGVWQHQRTAVPAVAPWWAGAWSGERDGLPQLQLQAQGKAVTGTITFRLNETFLVRLNLLEARQGDRELLFCVEPCPGLLHASNYYLLICETPAAAVLYRLRNLSQSQHQVGGASAVLIPTAAAHERVGRLKKATPSRLELNLPAAFPPAQDPP